MVLTFEVFELLTIQRHCERSEAIQGPRTPLLPPWIASSLRSSQ
jgi:hypothetical protein